MLMLPVCLLTHKLTQTINGKHDNWEKIIENTKQNKVHLWNNKVSWKEHYQKTSGLVVIEMI